MTEQIKYIESALKKVKDQKENFGFMDRFTVAENCEVTKALEKQIPRTPIQIEGYKEPCFCPICEPSDETFVKATCEHDKYNYCPICGQKIDWSDEDE